ncbi:hypothetical protein CROQUDRAFT_75355 [Cronartium quercuum f. sp. fusiforme G11]|uniref:C2H2-type domain-containing protein n=1 Tax=Cronartium quercuum f. sp. fusiforme G11 TaxID=708437 RepID=A0A9P6TF77_9BASI|nr:hypothetical protein CROQUDRAFT_75355 [Cronartium quercuum f. sp. fusiforme G11]
MFARAFNMESHQKTHIGYRPHECPKVGCTKRYSRRHELHKHLAAVHNDHNKLPLTKSKPVILRSLKTNSV